MKLKNTLLTITPILLLITVLLLFSKNEDTSNLQQQATEFYVGTYTNGESEGIYKYLLRENGELELVSLVAKSENPSFLAKSTDGKYLVAVNENTEGTVESYKIGKDSLEFVNRSSSGGAHPCFVTMNEEDYILVANYSGGNIGLLQLNKKGRLSPLLDVQQHKGKGTHKRQEAPHAHSAWFTPTQESIISVDLGTNELIFSQIDAKAKKLTPSSPNKLPMDTEAGPRHLAFHPNNKWIYVINELNSSVSLVTKEKDKYELISSFSTLPKGYSGESNCADIHISKDGKFLYASNRGHNSITIFSIQETGELMSLGHEPVKGNWPRNFALSPDNKFLLVANQYSENIVSFMRNEKTGKLSFVSEVKAPAPVCILF